MNKIFNPIRFCERDFFAKKSAKSCCTFADFSSYIIEAVFPPLFVATNSLKRRLFMLPVFIVSIEDDSTREFMTKLYLRFYNPMLKKARAMVGDDSSAEEIVQETFLRLIKKSDYVMNIDRPKIPYYLMAAVRNTAVDSYRKLKKGGFQVSFSLDDEAAAETVSDISPQPDEIYIHAELCSEVAESIAMLSDRDRLLLEAKYLLEESDEEIAAEFGISVNSVRSVLCRARKRAYKLLQKE